MLRKDFDYIIIGGGPAGCTIATRLAKSKKSVAIVEEHVLGGTHLTRDVPFLINLDFAHSYDQALSFPATSGLDLPFNLSALIDCQEQITSELAKENLARINDLGITVLNGFASFVDDSTISVGSNTYSASNFVIASGAGLKTTGISGLDSVNHLTPSSCIKVKRLPKCVFVAGGGATGCEIAEYFAKLGTKVIIMERGPHLLPKEDKDIGDELTDYFTNELGIMVMSNAKVIALEQDDISKRVIFSTGRQQKFVRVDCIVLATGSEPNLALDLENANIGYKKTGITINKNFQTTNKHIYAIGDAVGHFESSTESAILQADTLASILLRKAKSPANFNELMRQVSTDPGIATIGYNEYDLLARDRKYRKVSFRLSNLPLSITYNQKYGLIKIITDTSNRIIGISIMAKNATEIAISLIPFIKAHASLSEILDYTFPTNTIESAIQNEIAKLRK